MFQSTLARERTTLEASRRAITSCVFQSTLARERTTTSVFCPFTIEWFQSTLARERTTTIHKLLSCPLHVSIHARARANNDLRPSPLVSGQFQSTLARERTTWPVLLGSLPVGRFNPRSRASEQRDSPVDLGRQKVSIHARARANNMGIVASQPVLMVSIHARARANNVVSRHPITLRLFQSTLARERTTVCSLIAPVFRSFQSTLARERTTVCC